MQLYESRAGSYFILILRGEMLSFSAEFPIDAGLSLSDFLESIRDWIAGSPHSQFSLQELDAILHQHTFEIRAKGQTIKGNRIGSQVEHSAAFQIIMVNGDTEYTTYIVFSKIPSDCWISVRTHVESAHPTLRLPPAKKPILVRLLLDRFGGALDGPLEIRTKPHFLGNDDIDTAAQIILGLAQCWLPVVYVSCGFDGQYIVDPQRLALSLSGMAHVVVEPNRPFSQRLKIEVQSANSYGGSIGLYWPNAAGRRSFFLGRSFEEPSEIEGAIVDEVRAALLNRRPLYRCTVAAVEEASSRAKLEALRASGNVGIEEYVRTFDRELAARKTALDDSEREIKRLTAEIRKYEADASIGHRIALSLGVEQDLYSYESYGVVIDAVRDALSRVQRDSRREHILESIVRANTLAPPQNEFKEKIKGILRGYVSMDNPTRTSLEKIGFHISEDGKHIKLVYRQDDRYTFALAKSGSDKRGGLNSASDISKRLF